MGTISHDALIVMAYDGGYAEEVRQKVLDIAAHMDDDHAWAALVSPVIHGLVNGDASFYVAPDGSKEWWDTSDRGDGFREAIIGALGDEVTVVQVRWGELGYRLVVDDVPMERHDS